LRYVGPQTPFTAHIPRLATRPPFSSFNPQTEFSHFLLAGVVRRIVVTPPIVILEKKKKTLLRGNKQTVVVKKACAECRIHQTTKKLYWKRMSTTTTSLSTLHRKSFMFTIMNFASVVQQGKSVRLRVSSVHHDLQGLQFTETL
jgi:hypothetical protein